MIMYRIIVFGINMPQMHVWIKFSCFGKRNRLAMNKATMFLWFFLQPNYFNLGFFKRCADSRTNSNAAGIPGISTSATITRLKFCFTNGTLPKKYPTRTNKFTHNNAPITLKSKNTWYVMRPIPATNGAKVRMIGKNRARITVTFPCFS